MQITILAVGKSLSSDLQAVASTYEKRLQPMAAVTWKLLPASKTDDQDLSRAYESKQLLDQIKSNETVILLDERGTQLTNEQFAQTFHSLAGNQGKLILIIGGAFGVNEELRNRAQFVWSFSTLVFPHQLIRVMLLEQLYRTMMVHRGHPYHHV